jgi:hypothetical protein
MYSCTILRLLTTKKKLPAMKNLSFFPLLLLAFLLFDGCKKDEEFCDDPTDQRCPNYDPCTLAVAANSDFKIVVPIRHVADTIIDIEVDTSRGGGGVYFKAVVTTGLESYAWKVGADPRTFTESEINLDFTAYVGDVSITLETTAASNMMCLEEAQLKDVRTKRIYYAARGATGSIDGVFKGRVIGDAEGQEYEVQIGDSPPPFRRLRGLPLPADCDFNGRGIPLFSGYQYFVSTFRQEVARPRCRNLIVVGRINLEDSNELRIEYVYDGDDGKRKEVVFVGRRV